MNTTDYRPAAHVVDRLRQVNFVAVVGPTAVGKTTLINAAIQHEPSIHLVLNNTTRPRRPGERDGVDYLFQTRAAMEARIAKGEYVQVAPSVLGELYATAPEGYSTDGVAVMAVLAEAVPLFRALPFQSMTSLFVIPPDWATWQQRLEQHGFAPEQRQKRLAEAERSLQFALSDHETRIVINENLDKAAEDFVSVALGRPLDARQQADQARARHIIGDLLEQLHQTLNM